MSKDELVKAIATASKHTNKDVESMLKAFVDSVIQILKKGKQVRIIGFGIFKTIKRKARSGRNPKTGASLKIPARTAAKFIPGSKLKGFK